MLEQAIWDYGSLKKNWKHEGHLYEQRRWYDKQRSGQNSKAPFTRATDLPRQTVTWQATRALTRSSVSVKSPVDRFTVAFPLVALDDREAEPRSCMWAF